MLDLSVPTFIFALINLLVVYFVLKKFLFVPITNFMEKRKNNIIESMNEAKRKEEKAEQKLEEYTKHLKQAQKEAQVLYEKAIEKSRIEHASIISAAKKEAKRIKKNGYLEIEKERESLSREIQSQVSKLSILIASKLLKENMDTEKNKILVEHFLSIEDAAR